MPIIKGIKNFILQKAKDTEFDVETGNFADLEIRQAQLRAERDAARAVAPDATERLRALDLQLRLERVGQRTEPAHGVGIA